MEVVTLDCVKEKVKTIFENNGIIVAKDDDSDDNIDVSAIDSITFISFIVDVESVFDIAFPDELLSIVILQSVNGFTEIVYGLLNEKYNK